MYTYTPANLPAKNMCISITSDMLIALSTAYPELPVPRSSLNVYTQRFLFDILLMCALLLEYQGNAIGYK